MKTKGLEILLNEDYRAKTVQLNLALQKKIIHREGMNKRKTSWRTIGYYNGIESLLKGYIKLEIRNSDIKSLEEVIDKISELENKVDNIRKGIIQEELLEEKAS